MKKMCLIWISLNHNLLSIRVNPRNKDAAIEVYMSSLEEKLMKIEIPQDKYNIVTGKEQQSLDDLANDKKYCY